ncbi:MAG TPA: SGNH/GDSL hydrolase family protein [Gemmataceae bacterium]|nr:SGNH/GDSL hydrolase family protein [Gemmataceae bacterium]
MPRALTLSCLICGLASGSAHAAADRFQLQNGDRVVLLGNTLIEREQRSGYWETLLTSRYPDRNIQFRNLGWSGDTVFGEAWAEFDTAAVGFQRLKEHVFALKPTVIVIGYGLNESFEGEAGLPHFLKGLGTLLDTLTPTRARMVLLSPLRHEDLGRPLPDPAEHNRNLRLYRDALRKVAARRGCPFVDLYDLLGDVARAKTPAPLTDNGIHLTAYGYWRAAAALERGLGLEPPQWLIQLDAGGKTGAANGARLRKSKTSPLCFEVIDAGLPGPPAPVDSPKGAALPRRQRRLRVLRLAAGKYVLKIDGKPAATATADEWAAGVELKQGPEFDQAEKLRQAIILKNRLYFRRWRPANDTYLFGFRKYEQGQNAKEIPQFDPLVAKQEALIARLRVPVGHRYEIKEVSRKDAKAAKEERKEEKEKAP